MSSPYSLSNAQLQYLHTDNPTRFTLFAALLPAVSFTVLSQDLAQAADGSYTIIESVDLLASGKEPYAPQVNMGPNRIGFVGEPLFFDGSRSTQRGNLPALAHDWSGTTGSPTIVTYTGPHSTSGSQASMTWRTAGTYTVSLTVADRFGNARTGLRQVAIYPSRGETPSVYGLSSLQGQLDGGYTATLSTTRGIFSAVGTAQKVPDPSTLSPGTFLPVVVMVERAVEVAPGLYQSVSVGPNAALVPGQSYDDPRILFSGYVSSAGAASDDVADSVQLSLASVDLILKQCGVHNIGYYSTNYGGYSSTGVPTSQTPPPGGQAGQWVTNLTSEDVYRSLLGDHSTVGQHHDVYIWRDFLPTSDLNTRYYLSYGNLSVQEGDIWSGLAEVANNEFASVYAERDSSIRIGPVLAMRGYDMLNSPTLYGSYLDSSVVNLAEDHRPGALPQPVYEWFLFGPSALPQPQDVPGGYSRNLSALVGPPVAAHLSDVAIPDPGSLPADPLLLPPTVASWPQDISVRPLQLSVAENYTTKASFTKLIMSTGLGGSVWSSWFPQGAFVGQGAVTVDRMAAGTWDVRDQSSTSLLPDVTIASSPVAKALVWQYLWEMARRIYLFDNKAFDIQATLPAASYLAIGDLILVTRQNAVDGPVLSAVPFYVTGLSHSLDQASQTWTTQLSASLVTSYGIGPVITPPFSVPVS